MEHFVTELSLFFKSLLTSTVQVSVLVCLVLAVKAMVCRHLTVRWHYWLWLLVLVRMVMPWAPESNFSMFNLVAETKKVVTVEQQVEPSLAVRQPPVKLGAKQSSSPSSSPSPSSSSSSSSLSDGVALEGDGAGSFSLRVFDVLALVWFAVTLGLAGFALVCNFRLWRIIKSKRLLTQGRILELLEDCKAEMGVQTVLGVVVTDKVKSPALFGVVRPRLLLPKEMLEKLSKDELRYVFLHELAHLKRHDIYLGWLMVGLQVLHWFNPLVWFAFGRMRADRELACDGLVLSTMDAGESKAYGQTLLDIFKGFSQLQFVPGIAGILENKSQLKRRITMISRFKKGSYQLSVLAVVLLAVLSCVALTNAQTVSDAEKEPVTLAKEFVELLVKGKFSQATKHFDATMKGALPADKLAEVWKGIATQAGLFDSQLGVRTEKYMSYDIVLITCQFEKGPLDAKVVYNEQKQVSGLFFIPTPQDVLKRYQNSKTMVKPSGSDRKKLSTPQVVSSNPAALSNDVSPELTKITVTFDQPMMDGSWSWTGGGETFPGRTGSRPGYDSSKTTCTMPVELEAGKVYWVGINSPSHKNFKTADRMPAKRYVILFATSGIDGEPTPIPQDMLAKAKRINAKTRIIKKAWKKKARKAVRKSSSQGKRVKLSYDDGSSEGKKSIAGGGHAVMFDAPDEGCTLKAVRIYGARYGHDKAPREDFHIWLYDEDFNVIKDFPFRYSRFKKGKPKWVTLRVEPVEVPSTFVIFADFNPEQSKGVYVHYDDSSSGNSLIGLPGDKMRVFDDGEWMIQAMVQKPQTESQTSVPPEGRVKANKTDTLASESLAVEGWSLWRQRKLAEAESKFKQAVQKDSKNENAYQGLGWAQLNQGKKLNAKNSFEKCVEINPKNSAALNGLGWIAHGQGNKDEAIGWWEKAVEAAPGATASLNGLTEVYMEREQYREAIKYYKMWLVVEPDNAKAKAGLEKVDKTARADMVENTEDVTDLQSLIDSASAGSTVTVAKGVYTEPVVISKPLTLLGESVSDCVFEVTANRPAIFIDTKGKGEVNIEGITVKWQLATSDKNIDYPFAVGVKDSEATISNCNFVPLGNFQRSPVATQAIGFAGLVVDNCRFQGFGYPVFYKEGTTGAVKNSMILDCGSQGITLFRGASVEIVGNVIAGSSKHGIRNTGGKGKIWNNLIVNNANRGIYLGNKSAKGFIRNNIIIGNAVGIGSFARSAVKISNNVIADSTYSGIGFHKSCRLRITNNIFVGNEKGWVMFDKGGENGNVCQRNTFWDNKVDAENFQRTGNSILSNPGFVDWANGVFSLKPGPALENKQGLTNPEILEALWRKWKR